MNTIRNMVVAAGMAVTMSPVLAAAPVLLDFEGIAAPGAYVAIGSFYAGLGVDFDSSALALNGYNGTNEPTPTSILFFLSADAATLNYAAGFETGFSFYYSSASATGNVQVYDGLNGSGNLLASMALNAQYNIGCSVGSIGDFCNWTPIGVQFAGVAKSVQFGGTANLIAFDNVTIGSSAPLSAVPESSTTALMMLGLTAVGVAARRRKSALSGQ